MGIFNSISENLIIPVSDLLLHRSISSHFRLLMRSQWWSADQLAEFQDKKLKEIIVHSYKNVPYYYDLFRKTGITPEDIKTREDLVKIPILTKEDIRRNFPGRITAGNINRRDYYIAGSSGSTGEPLKYYISRDAYSMNTAAKLRGWYWMGYRLGDRFVKLSQNPRKSLEKRLQDFINRDRYLHVQHLTSENFEMILREIKAYNPKIIRGYPDPLLFLAQFAQKKHIKGITPIAINTTGNILYDEARKLIERQFETKIFDSYNSEAGAVTFECVNHTCYHLAMEYAVTEVLKNGKEAEAGQKGTLVTTDLMNYSMPFIRYDTQDIVTKGPQTCDCGRSLATLSRIEGRDNDILVTPSGKYLIVHNFTGYFQSSGTPAFGKVDQFQVVQDKIDSITINIVPGNNFSEETEFQIKHYWETYIGDDVRIQVATVDKIPESLSGKRRFLLRNPEIKLFL